MNNEVKTYKPLTEEETLELYRRWNDPDYAEIDEADVGRLFVTVIDLQERMSGLSSVAEIIGTLDEVADALSVPKTPRRMGDVILAAEKMKMEVAQKDFMLEQIAHRLKIDPNSPCHAFEAAITDLQQKLNEANGGFYYCAKHGHEQTEPCPDCAAVFMKDRSGHGNDLVEAKAKR